MFLLKKAYESEQKRTILAINQQKEPKWWGTFFKVMAKIGKRKKDANVR